MAAGRAAAPQSSNAGEDKNITPIIIAVAAVVALVIAGILFFVVGGKDTGGGTNAGTSQNTELSGESEATKQPAEENAEDGSDDEPVASGAPRFSKISASSVLTGDVDSHQPDRLVDGSTTTAWCEGVTGNGEGEWVEFQADMKQNVTSVTIMGGFCKSEDLYWMNSRPKDITITFDDGSKTTSTLSDEPFAWHTITLAKPVQTKTIRITIDSVYAGSNYTDTSISEITVQ